MLIVLMGVAGSGKTTVGRTLATELDWIYFDGDDFHSRAAIEKMHHGLPLNDPERAGWLGRLRRLFLMLLIAKRNAVISCSALKQSYRDFLRSGIDPSLLRFVFLDVSPELARVRMQKRVEHFMPESLFASQFKTLEPPSPSDALWVSSDQSVSQIVSVIGSKFQLGLPRTA